MANRKDRLRLVVIESRFTLLDRTIYFGRAKLLPDRVILKALGYRETIPLGDIVDVRWQGAELMIVLQNGDEYELMIDSAPMWKLELQSRCHLHDNSFGTSVRKLNELSSSGEQESEEDPSDDSTPVADISGNGYTPPEDGRRTGGLQSGHESVEDVQGDDETDDTGKDDNESGEKPSWYRVNRLFDPDDE